MNNPITLLSSIVEHREPRSHGGQSISFDPTGEPHARALVDAVVDHYHRITCRPRPSLATLRELTGSRVTIAYTSRNLYGAPHIDAREGTLMPVARYYPDYTEPALGTGLARNAATHTASGRDQDRAGDNDGVTSEDTRLVLRPVGNRTRAVALDAADVLDVERGYGHLEQMRGLVALCQNRLPRLKPLTQADLQALPSYNTPAAYDSDPTAGGVEHDTDADKAYDDADEPDDDAPTFIRVAVMGTWRGPGGDSPAAIWLLHSYDPADDITEGYLLVDPAYGYSEHGSTYGRNLLRFGGRIVLPAPTPAPTTTSATEPAAGPGAAGGAHTPDGVITRPDGQPLTLTDAFALGEQSPETWLAYFTR